MASAPEVPDLLGSDALMQFLQAGLQQLESDQGCEDDEARGLLQMLQQQTTLMQALQGVSGQQGGSAMTDLQIAEQIDSLDAQLSQLEASLSSADASTMQLLGQSTSTWLNSDSSRQPSKNNTQATSSSTRMDGNSSSSTCALQAAGCSDNSSSQEEATQSDGQGSGSTSTNKASVQEAAAAVSAGEEAGSKADDPAVHSEGCVAQDVAAATCATHADGAADGAGHTSS